MNQRGPALRTSWIAAAVAAFALPLAPPVLAASLDPLSGAILGEVKNAAGVAQMGAAVYLYNRYDELVRRGLTNEAGRFAFDGLAPDLYSIRVILASFVPAERRNISVLPNSENRLDINLTSVLSTVTLSTAPSRGTLMTDDWKWVLRTSQSTRPVLRMLPGDQGISHSGHSATSVFSNTTGVVQVSAGDGESFAHGSGQDLGTAFALATSLAGAGRVQLSGNIGYSGNAALPGAGIRTSYSHPGFNGSDPEFVMTMRQVYLTPRYGSGVAIGSDGAPVLRTMSAAYVDKMEAAEDVRIDYGFDFQSVSYLDRLNYLSPFARLTYDLGPQGRVRAGFSSGAQPTELLVRDSERHDELEQNLNALAVMPTISLSNSHVAAERTQNIEISYERVAGSRTYSVGAYQENVTNAAFMISAPGDFLPAGDLLPDLSSNSSIFNIGTYKRTGYTVAVSQAIGENTQVSIAAGRTGALAAAATEPTFADSSELRAAIRPTDRNWVTLRASTVVPGSGTRVTASYGWTDFSVLMPVHVYLTQNATQDTGVNLYVRQPLPRGWMPMRVEATAELQNLLAQGYLPLGCGVNRAVLTF
jgi:hypothetical protein